MPDVGRTPEPSLDDIHLSDSFIEALASGRPIAPQDQGDAALAALLGGWRDETRWPPDTALISESQAIAALNAGLAEKPSRGTRERRDIPPPATRHRRGLSVIGAAAAAALCLGGFGAVVNGSQPGDSLYGLRTMLFGTPKEVRDQKVGLAAKSELMKVQELISQGDWEQAQEKLVAVSTQVASVGDEQQKQELLTQFNDLSAKVVERNPEATAPPGIVYTVAPSAAELVPAVAPPSDTATTTSGEATSTEATTTTSGASSTTSTSGAGTSETPTSASATSQSSSAATPASTPATTSTSTPATTSAPTPATTSAPTPATSSAPAAASTPVTTQAPTAAATSTTPSAAAATTTAPSAASTAAATSTEPSSAAASTASATQSATTATPATTSAAPAVTTTAVPVPAG